jgi:hypothetical protein
MAHEDFCFWLSFQKPLAAFMKDLKLYVLLKSFLRSLDLAGLRLNFHTGILLGFFSIAWSGHLIDEAIPLARGLKLYHEISYAFSQNPRPLFG